MNTALDKTLRMATVPSFSIVSALHIIAISIIIRVASPGME
jgi:hypothetical protein